MSHEPLTSEALPEKDFHRKYKRTAGTLRDFTPSGFGYLGGGRTGSVYKYKHRVTGDIVAVKQFNIEGVHELSRKYQMFLKFMRTEHKIYRKLQYVESTDNYDGGHPNIVKLLGYYWDGGPTNARFILELTGPSLKIKFKRVGRCLTESETRPIVEGIASAIIFMHEREICHRDLKMSNVLCPVQRYALHPVKLCDMEGGKLDDSNKGLSPMKSPTGSYHVIDPMISWNYLGILRRDKTLHWKSYNRRCDVYSLGVIMYKLLTRADLYNDISCSKHAEDMVLVKGKWYNKEWEHCSKCVDAVLARKSEGQFIPEDSYLKSTTSEPCKMLLRRMLEKDHQQRIHARQLQRQLQRWFQRPYPESLLHPTHIELDPEIPYSDDEGDEDDEVVCQQTMPMSQLDMTPLRERALTM